MKLSTQQLLKYIEYIRRELRGLEGFAADNLMRTESVRDKSIANVIRRRLNAIEFQLKRLEQNIM